MKRPLQIAVVGCGAECFDQTGPFGKFLESRKEVLVAIITVRRRGYCSRG